MSRVNEPGYCICTYYDGVNDNIKVGETYWLTPFRGASDKWNVFYRDRTPLLEHKDGSKPWSTSAQHMKIVSANAIFNDKLDSLLKD